MARAGEGRPAGPKCGSRSPGAEAGGAEGRLPDQQRDAEAGGDPE